MGNLWTNYKGGTPRFFSGNIWADSPWAEGVKTGGYFDHDDFRNFAKTFDVATNIGRYSGGWVSYEDDNASIGPLLTNAHGVVRLDTGAATDNLEVNMSRQGGVAGNVTLDVSDDGALVCFEARFAAGVITSGNLFIGLTEEGLNVTDGFFTDANAHTDKDYIGLRILSADADGLDFVYHKAGQTEVVVAEVAQVLVAGTFYNVGWRFDPLHTEGRKLEGFVDNVRVGSAIIGSTANPTAAFPNGEEMCLGVCVKNSTTAQCTLDLDDIALGWAAG